MNGDRAPVSVVLRALRDSARLGRLVGQAEVVSTGEVVTIRSVDEFIDLLQRLAVDRHDHNTASPSGGRTP